MKEDVLFKKTPFGGFDRVEVISYIQKLKETQQKYKVMLDEKDALNKTLTEDNELLRRQIELLTSSVKESEEKLALAEKQVEDLKSEQLSRQSKDGEKSAKPSGAKFAADTVKMCDELVETASNTAKEIIKQAKEEYDEVYGKIKHIASEVGSVKNRPAKEVKAMIKKLAEELDNG